MVNNQPKLSIVIPAYKEERTIAATIKQIKAHLPTWNLKHGRTEVIISVGASPDNTLRVANKAVGDDKRFKVLDAGLPHDKGHVVKVGMLEADGDYRVYMDADLATPLHHVDKTVSLLKFYDVVNGQRLINTIHTGTRKFISIACNRFVRLFILPGYPDTQCGFKGFRKTIAEDVFRKQSVNSWGFDMEILALAKQNRASVRHLPINDWSDKDGGTLNENPVKALKAAIYTFIDLVKIRLQLSSGFYKSR